MKLENKIMKLLESYSKRNNLGYVCNFSELYSEYVQGEARLYDYEENLILEYVESGQA